MSRKQKNSKHVGEYIIKVLDTDYELYIDNNNPELEENDYGGLTDTVLKTIHIQNVFSCFSDRKLAVLELKRVLRHELIHAFIYECGLTENSSEKVAWPVSESFVDWLAVQFYKLEALFEDAYQIIPEISEQT